MAISEGSVSLLIKRKQFLPQCFMKEGNEAMIFKIESEHDSVLSSKRKENFRKATKDR